MTTKTQYKAQLADKQGKINELEGYLRGWRRWYEPIRKALNEGDNLRALALMEPRNRPNKYKELKK